MGTDRNKLIDDREKTMQAKRPILLVEDPAARTPAAKHALDDLGVGDHLICSATMPEAMVHLRSEAQQRPAVVLLSVDDPSCDGLATLRTIKSDEQLKTVPVVVLGPSGDERAVDESFGLGAAGYMVKSADHQELSQTLRTFCEYWSLSEIPK